MKIIFTLLLCVSLFIGVIFPSFSQTEKGSKMIGGSGYVLFDDPLAIGLFPGLGFFVVDNLALGASLQLNFSRYDTHSFSGAGAAPFIRYYFGKSQTRVFTQANVGYDHYWTRSFNQRDEVIHSRGDLFGSLDLGLTRFISDQVGLEFALNYRQRFEQEDPARRLSLTMGFQIYIPSTR